LGAEAKRGETSAFRGSRAESDVLDLRVLDLLDFASERAGTRAKLTPHVGFWLDFTPR
jgi:hypothetical protein